MTADTPRLPVPKAVPTPEEIERAAAWALLREHVGHVQDAEVYGWDADVKPPITAEHPETPPKKAP